MLRNPDTTRPLSFVVKKSLKIINYLYLLDKERILLREATLQEKNACFWIVTAVVVGSRLESLKSKIPLLGNVGEIASLL